MNKRGQIFLTAALIIGLVIISIATVYNSAYSVNRSSKIVNTALEIKGEGLRTLDYGVAKGKNFEEIAGLIDQVLGNYSALNPDITILAWLYYPPEEKEMNFSYDNGKRADIPAALKIKKDESKSQMEVIWVGQDRNIYYDLSLNMKAYNFNVLVEKDGENERIIAAE